MSIGKRRFFLWVLLMLNGGAALVGSNAMPAMDEGGGYSAGKLQHLDTAALAAKIRAKKEKKYNFTLIDTRNEADFQKGSIPGAINLPFKQHRFLAEKAAPATADIVCYGYSNNPSTVNGAVYLINHGYEHVWFYDGGYDEWKNSPESTAGEPDAPVEKEKMQDISSRSGVLVSK